MNKSKIEWTDSTWNPVTGCTKVSGGCANCYAEKISNRFTGNFDVTLHLDRLDQPIHWKKPRKIFVCSMGDIFHDDVPHEVRAQIFGVMAACPQHTFQILTKRPECISDFFHHVESHSGYDDENECEYCLNAAYDELWPQGDNRWISEEQARKVNTAWPLKNLWLGVSVEDQKTADERIPLLLATPAAKRFVSIEPMLGPIELDNIQYDKGAFANSLSLEEWTGLEDAEEVKNDGMGGGKLLDWVIVGGETGPDARPMHPDWVRSIRDQCQAAEVPFFFKGWGEWAPNCLCDRLTSHPTKKRPEPGKPGVMFRCGKVKSGNLLDGRTWQEYPCGGAR